MLVDAFGREVTDIRVSVTKRCNFGCIYCHDEGLGPILKPRMPHEDEMSVAEIERLLRVAREFGIRSVKFTGGEPLIRLDMEQIIDRSVRQLPDVSMTTNGSMLAKRAEGLRDAGLKRVNVSIDSLDPAAFRDIRKGELAPVLRGIQEALRVGLKPVKLNMVVFKQTLPHIPRMIEYISDGDGLKLQLIQFMPELVGQQDWMVDIDALKKWLEGRADKVLVREMHHRRIYIFNGAEVEVVDPVYNAEFCMNCHRIRVTHQGELKGCLNRNDDLIPTRGLDDEGLRAAFRNVVANRVPYYGGYMTGAYGLPGAFALIFLVSTLTFIPWALIGYIAADKGASSVSLLRPAFGLRGSKLPSVFYLFFGYGWAAVNVFIAAISMSFVFNITLGWPDAFHTPAGSPINYYLVPSILLICFLQGFFATAGHRAIRYLNWASTVALVALGAYASYIVMKDFDFGQLWAYRPAQPLSFTFTAGALGTGFTYTLTFPLLLDLLIAYNWTWEFIGDFSRFARSKKAGTWGPFAGASLAQYWFFSVGALMTVAFLVTAPAGSVNFAAISDPSYKATQLGFGLGAYLIILFATISTNAGNIYASALGITNIATRWKTSMRRLLLLSAVIVVPLALLPLFETNFVFTYIFFLDFLGAIVVPLWTLTLVDYFLVKARRYSDDLFAQEGGHYWYRGGWNWPAVVTLLSGTALYWIIAFGFPTLRETISAALPTIVFVIIVYYFWGRSAWEKHLRALREARLVEATG